MQYSHLGNQRLRMNFKEMFLTEEELEIDSLIKAEQADQLLKGRPALPVGTKKKWGNNEYVKTSQGWKASKDIKEAHSKIHGKEIDEVDIAEAIRDLGFKDIVSDSIYKTVSIPNERLTNEGIEKISKYLKDNNLKPTVTKFSHYVTLQFG